VERIQRAESRSGKSIQGTGDGDSAFEKSSKNFLIFNSIILTMTDHRSGFSEHPLSDYRSGIQTILDFHQ